MLISVAGVRFHSTHVTKAGFLMMGQNFVSHFHFQLKVIDEQCVYDDIW